MSSIRYTIQQNMALSDHTIATARHLYANGMNKEIIRQEYQLILENGDIVDLRDNYVEELYKLTSDPRNVDTRWLHALPTEVAFFSTYGSWLPLVRRNPSETLLSQTSPLFKRKGSHGNAFPPPPSPVSTPEVSPRSRPKVIVSTGTESFHILLDQSSSMANMNNAAYEGARELVEELDKETLVTFTTFSTKVNIGTRLSRDDALTKLVTRVAEGTTALRDAICLAIEFEMRDPLDHVTIVVVTDGQDTSSIRSIPEVRRKVTEFQKKTNWRLIFLGANQDAVMTASEYGIPQDRALTYGANSAHMREATRVVSQNRTVFRSLGTDFFTPEMRSRVM